MDLLKFHSEIFATVVKFNYHLLKATRGDPREFLIPFEIPLLTLGKAIRNKDFNTTNRTKLKW